jgi:hypothetical protein
MPVPTVDDVLRVGTWEGKHGKENVNEEVLHFLRSWTLFQCPQSSFANLVGYEGYFRA